MSCVPATAAAGAADATWQRWKREPDLQTTLQQLTSSYFQKTAAGNRHFNLKQ